MMKHWVLTGLMLALLSQRVDACGGYTHPTYLVYGGRDPLRMPTAAFNLECDRILHQDPPPEPKMREWQNLVEAYEMTVRADIADLAEAVSGRGNAEEMVKRYEGLRNRIGGYVGPRIKQAYRNYDPLRAKEAPLEVDVSGYENFLEQLPAEFARYIQGAIAYHRGEPEAAAEAFASVLELPPDQRQYRSTWAAYVRGKCLLRIEPEEAGRCFEMVRELADQGFHDSLELAAGSAGWQARAALEAKDYVAALHAYAAIETDPCRTSLRAVCKRALGEEEIPFDLVHDELCRQVIAAWLVAHPREKKMAEKWLAAVDAAGLEGPVEFAEHLAWMNYQQGAMDAAGRWVQLSDPEAPYAQLVRARLLLREGDLEGGKSILEHLTETVPQGRAWRVEAPEQGGLDSVHEIVQGDLGYLQCREGDYAEALRSFLRAGRHEDALYIMEFIMSPEELEAFLKEHEPEPTPIDPHPGWFYMRMDLEAMRAALARRWALVGEWDRAMPYYREEDRDTAAQARAHAEGAQDPGLPARTRAEHLFELAQLIHEHSQVLISPGLLPPVASGYGSRIPEVSPDFSERLARNQEPYPRMNFYRYIAANRMWDCAQLLPNNDALCARALYQGGMYLKRKDPEAADRFYKALVRRNPNLLIARQADRLRWFPKEFTDEILYWPLPKDPWYGRKLWVAEGGLAAILLLGALAALVLIMRKRRARATAGLV